MNRLSAVIALIAGFSAGVFSAPIGQRPAVRFSEIEESVSGIYLLLNGHSGQELNANSGLVEVLRTQNARLANLAQNSNEMTISSGWDSRGTPSDFVLAVFKFIRAQLAQTIPGIQSSELRNAVLDSLRLFLAQANIVRLFVVRLNSHRNDPLPEHLLDPTFNSLSGDLARAGFQQ